MTSLLPYEADGVADAGGIGASDGAVGDEEEVVLLVPQPMTMASRRRAAGADRRDRV